MLSLHYIDAGADAAATTAADACNTAAAAACNAATDAAVAIVALNS
jgi:hypothetical protein